MKRQPERSRPNRLSSKRIRRGASVRCLLAVLLALPASLAFAQDAPAAGAAVGVYPGMLAALMLHSLLLWLAARDRAQSGLLLLAAGASLGLLAPDGISAAGALPGWATRLLQAGPALAGVGGAMLARSFLGARTNAPRIDGLLQVSILLFAAAAAAAFALPIRIDTATGVALGTLALIALSGGLRVRPQCIPCMDLYLLGSASILFGLLVAGARHWGLIADSAPATHAAQAGIVLGLVMLSVALAARNITRHQRLAEDREQDRDAREHLIESLQRSEQLLTQQLAQRGRELEAAREQMHDADRGAHAAALYDPLTGVANHLVLVDRIAQGIARSKRHNCRTAVLLVGLDDLDTVIGTAGNPIGEEVLKMAAGRLRGIVRDVDTVARPASGEFALVLADVFDPQDLERVASEVASQLGQVFVVDGHTIMLSASVGCAIFPEDGADATALLRRAEKLMLPTRNGDNCPSTAAARAARAREAS